MAKSDGGSTKAVGLGDVSKRLKDIPSIPATIRAALQALDIVRADQLTGATSSPTGREALGRHLGVSQGDLEKSVAAAAQTLPKGDAPPKAATNFQLGALMPPASVQAAAMSIPFSSTSHIRASLPRSANLVSRMSPIRSQGDRGTCVAFCLTAIHEFQTKAKNDDFSERFLYYQAKKLDGTPSACGTTQTAAAEALKTLGQCLEGVWQYNPHATCNDHGTLPSGAGADAAKHRIVLESINPQDLVAMKTAVASKRPVGISIPVFASWYQSPTTERTGRITMPIGGENRVGGHCMCIVGYKDDGPETVTETPGGGFFILRNSWGTQWGEECAYGAGYGTIPYAYIAALNWEAFTLPKGKGGGGARKTKKKAKSRRAKAKSGSAGSRTATR
jgi:hypothetical protein